MTSSDQRDAVRELIPLYVNGALKGPERARFELRIQHDAVLRREVDEFEEIESAFRAAEARAAVDLGKVFEAVQDRLSREVPLRRTRLHRGIRWLEWAREKLFTPQIGWAVAAAQLAVFAVLILGLPQRGAEPIETLSDGRPATQPAGRRIHVVFAPHATQEQVQSLLAGVGARISDGPNEVGAYTIQLRSNEPNGNEVLQRLRASEIVVFAEFAY
ncbi:MAG TPA: hypothetical protein VIL32_00935 [Steroidobacteraceae bacterium]